MTDEWDHFDAARDAWESGADDVLALLREQFPEDIASEVWEMFRNGATIMEAQKYVRGTDWWKEREKGGEQ